MSLCSRGQAPPPAGLSLSQHRAIEALAAFPVWWPVSPLSCHQPQQPPDCPSRIMDRQLRGSWRLPAEHPAAHPGVPRPARPAPAQEGRRARRCEGPAVPGRDGRPGPLLPAAAPGGLRAAEPQPGVLLGPTVLRAAPPSPMPWFQLRVWGTSQSGRHKPQQPPSFFAGGIPQVTGPGRQGRPLLRPG